MTASTPSGHTSHEPYCQVLHWGMKSQRELEGLILPGLFTCWQGVVGAHAKVSTETKHYLENRRKPFSRLARGWLGRWSCACGLKDAHTGPTASVKSVHRVSCRLVARRLASFPFVLGVFSLFCQGRPSGLLQKTRGSQRLTLMAEQLAQGGGCFWPEGLGPDCVVHALPSRRDKPTGHCPNPCPVTDAPGMSPQLNRLFPGQVLQLALGRGLDTSRRCPDLSVSCSPSLRAPACATSLACVGWGAGPG